MKIWERVCLTVVTIIALLPFLLLLFAILIGTYQYRARVRTSVEDYQFMYDGVTEEWNTLASKGREQDSLLGYGKYEYHSYLVLFPRETPSTLKEFYYCWDPTIVDSDFYSIYFTCELSEENYGRFREGLASFTVSNGESEKHLLYDDSHFKYPAYVAQWDNVGRDWEVEEYVLLDDENRTAVFVYSLFKLQELQEETAYDILPSDMRWSEDFSIYDGFKDSTYDASFLAYLL